VQKSIRTPSEHELLWLFAKMTLELPVNNTSIQLINGVGDTGVQHIVQMRIDTSW
jgi:hypothetical protein